MSENTNTPKPQRDSEVIRIRRGIKRPSPAGTATFLGLRALDIPLQYKLISGAWSAPLLSRLGLAAAPTVAAAHTGIAAIDRLGLSPAGLVLLSMAAGSAIKQAYWLVFVSMEEFPVSNSLGASAINTIFNSMNSLLFLAAFSSASTAGPAVPIPWSGGASLPLPVAVGALLYAVGISTETISEIQRRRFKDRPENKGLIIREGLWGLARHINYGGYLLWRTGYCLAAGGWIAGAANAAFFAYNFVTDSIVELNGYMAGRYDEQWKRYRQEVKWALLPGIY